MQILYNLFSEMVNVDYDFRCSGSEQPLERLCQQRAASYGDKRFGHTVGEWLETCSQARREDEGFHAVQCLFAVKTTVDNLHFQRLSHATFKSGGVHAQLVGDTLDSFGGLSVVVVAFDGCYVHWY